MAKIKPLGEIAETFATVTSGRAEQYAKGVASPAVPWDQATAAAEPNYDQATTAAIQRKAFGKGVRRAGNSRYLHGAQGKGARNFGPGVAEAGPAYQQGYQKYHAAIAGLTLPQRFPRRDPRNLLRVSAIATVLGKLKEAGG